MKDGVGFILYILAVGLFLVAFELKKRREYRRAEAASKEPFWPAGAPRYAGIHPDGQTVSVAVCADGFKNDIVRRHRMPRTAALVYRDAVREIGWHPWVVPLASEVEHWPVVPHVTIEDVYGPTKAPTTPVCEEDLHDMIPTTHETDDGRRIKTGRCTKCNSCRIWDEPNDYWVKVLWGKSWPKSS